jgi:hypothetical protein
MQDTHLQVASALPSAGRPHAIFRSLQNRHAKVCFLFELVFLVDFSFKTDRGSSAVDDMIGPCPVAESFSLESQGCREELRPVESVVWKPLVNKESLAKLDPWVRGGQIEDEACLRRTE